MPGWMQQVHNIFQSQSTPVPDPVWKAIMLWESGGNPWAINLLDPNGGSYGLFQLNLGGQGKGYPRGVLLNPVENAKIAAPSISQAYAQALYFGYTGNQAAEYAATHSGHPGYAPVGRLLPAKGTPGYSVFQKEGQGVANEYNSITKGSPFHLLPTRAFIQEVTTDPGSILNPKPPQSSPWQNMIRDLNQASQIDSWTHPVNAIKGLVTYAVFLVLALILIFIGAKTMMEGG